MRAVRRLARFVTLVAVLAVLLAVPAAWYFSGRIHADGLAVDPAEVSRDLEVVRVGAGTVTIRGADDELRTRGTYGVDWVGGYGQVSGTPVGDVEVTRSFRVLTGRPLRVGDRVAVTEQAFPSDPAVALGVPVRDATVRAPGGAFPAWFVPGRGTTWVVLVHGKGTGRAEMLRAMRVPVGLGLPALAITYRNDALLPLDESRRYQYGRTEWEDLDAALAWAGDQGARRFVLVGASMGGAVVAETMERSARADQVAGLVLDAPLLSFDDAVDLGAEREDVPVLGSVPGFVTWAAKRLTTLRYGVDWDALDRLDDTSWVRVPTLVFHGTADARVPVASSDRLAEREPDRVRLVRLDGVAHVEAWNHDPAAYEDALRRFLSEVT